MMSGSVTEPVLTVDQLVVDYQSGRRKTRAVDDVSFQIEPGETLGLVGESGSGKTTIGMAVLGLVQATSGTIRFEGNDLARLTSRERRLLGRRRQVIFQDPYSSLDPTKTVGYTLAEPYLLGAHNARADAGERIAELLTRVGLSPDAANRYPAQFSGGQRQRIAIARALMLSPKLVVCDEPVSALDLSIQAEVMNLLAELQRELGISLLFISHDLSVVRHISHRLIVLEHGRVVERGDAEAIYESAQHPYTRALLAAAPVPDPAEQRARREARARAASSTVSASTASAGITALKGIIS
jgi:ABC-type oligopeptide transport system ATPase subunit